MEMTLTNLKRYCLENYGVVIQDPFIKKMTTFRKISHNVSACEIEPVIEWCELHATLKGGGFLFSLQRLNLHNQLTSNRLCSD